MLAAFIIRFDVVRVLNVIVTADSQSPFPMLSHKWFVCTCQPGWGGYIGWKMVELLAKRLAQPANIGETILQFVQPRSAHLQVSFH